MKQWHVNPKFMCNKHLLGEHMNHHSLVKAILKGKALDGYLMNNCLEPNSIKSRHRELLIEMKCRGMKHNSPLPKFTLIGLSPGRRCRTIDKQKSENELMAKCANCRKRKEQNERK